VVRADQWFCGYAVLASGTPEFCNRDAMQAAAPRCGPWRAGSSSFALPQSMTIADEAALGHHILDVRGVAEATTTCIRGRLLSCGLRICRPSMVPSGGPRAGGEYPRSSFGCPSGIASIRVLPLTRRRPRAVPRLVLFHVLHFFLLWIALLVVVSAAAANALLVGPGAVVHTASRYYLRRPRCKWRVARRRGAWFAGMINCGGVARPAKSAMARCPAWVTMNVGAADLRAMDRVGPVGLRCTERRPVTRLGCRRGVLVVYRGLLPEAF